MIRHFRQVISSGSRFYGWMAAIGMVFCAGLRFLFKGQPFPEALLNSGIIVSFIFLVHIMIRRQSMLRAMDPLHEDPAGQLESYLRDAQSRWENSIWLRVILGSLLAVAMLFFLFVFKESKWSQISASLFVVFILAVILKGWINFNDQILLHDLQRSNRDQDSDISD